MAGTVQARVRYLRPEWKDRNEQPRIDDRESRRACTRYYEVPVADARPRLERGDLDLDRSGFLLVEHASAVADFRDPDEVRRVYYPELTALLKRLTGARDVLFLHHLLRTETPESFVNAYARYVHCDYSIDGVRALTRRMLVDGGLCGPDDDVEGLEVAWYNAWQPIERPAETNPLTLIDCASVDEADLRPYDFAWSGDYRTASIPLYSEQHAHYYFPKMCTDEVLITKQHDTRPGRARACPHTSFDDPTTPADARPRRSVEVRAMCVFGPRAT